MTKCVCPSASVCQCSGQAVCPGVCVVYPTVMCVCQSLWYCVCMLSVSLTNVPSRVPGCDYRSSQPIHMGSRAARAFFLIILHLPKEGRAVLHHQRAITVVHHPAGRRNDPARGAQPAHVLLRGSVEAHFIHLAIASAVRMLMQWQPMLLRDTCTSRRGAPMMS